MLKTETTFLYRSDTLYDFVPFKAVNSVILCVFPFIAFTWQIKTFGSQLRGLGARINSSPNPSPVAGRSFPSRGIGGRRSLALEAKGEPPQMHISSGRCRRGPPAGHGEVQDGQRGPGAELAAPLHIIWRMDGQALLLFHILALPLSTAPRASAYSA